MHCDQQYREPAKDSEEALPALLFPCSEVWASSQLEPYGPTPSSEHLEDQPLSNSDFKLPFTDFIQSWTVIAFPFHTSFMYMYDCERAFHTAASQGMIEMKYYPFKGNGFHLFCNENT